jgi:hypothetical protein
MNRDEIWAAFRASAAEYLDGPMARHGFRLLSGDPRYVRKLHGTRQAVQMNIQVNPGGGRGPIAFFFPLVRIEMADVNRLVQDMMPQYYGWKLTMLLPLEITAPREHREKWTVWCEDGFDFCCARICRFMERFALPFLEEYATGEAMIRGYETCDSRVDMDLSYLLHLAAAYVIRGERDAALNVVAPLLNERHSAGYARAVGDYIARLSESTK